MIGARKFGGARWATGLIVKAWRADRSATAIEYAILLPVFLTLILGGMDAGRVMWTQITLQRAVQLAARCASVNTQTCGSASATQAYAASQAWGFTLAPSTFTAQSLACGNKVSASLPIQLAVPWLATSTVILSANACHPLQS
jgi:Flp pilus assembly protein TadG